MSLEQLYLYLIITGATILAVVALLLHQTQRQSDRIRELTTLNEQLKFDLPDLLNECWPILAAGGFLGMHWTMDWFGTPLSQQAGRVTRQVRTEDFSAKGINLTVSLYMPKSRWERRYFSNMLAESLFLLLRMNMWIKVGSVNATFEQSARMTVFLQHDIKNILQLLNLAADQIALSGETRQDLLLPMLKRLLPALRDRTQLVLTRLATGSDRQTAHAIDLVQFAREAAAVHELDADIEGSGAAFISNDALHSIVDNLLGNYLQLALANFRKPRITISIRESAGMVSCMIYDRDGKPFARPERLFEPFWSEKQRGRGIGLYQAREICKTWGGDLRAQAESGKPLKFVLEMPAAPAP